MSAILFIPALLLNLNFYFGIMKTVMSMMLLIAMQIAIGTEWILTGNGKQYFGKAFEFDRVFMFKWSVNWQFLGEEKAVGKEHAKMLLMA
jgi:alpha-1,3-mannosyltransferase